ncbi:MAG TPA: endonuclease/exonuclease/phosphatase family protein [Candidatus Dojkabacteria bacterium]|nr:endonuclease/exonuclease/phosphatase family protein [Candidatus Dojkabacteria bacterium]
MNKIIKIGLILPFITLIGLISISYTFYGELFLSFLPYAVGIYLVYMITFTVLLVASGADIKRANTYWVNWFLVFMIFLGIFSFYFDLGVSAADENSKSLKVISANIWYKNVNTDEMRNFLENENADIIMLTEFTNDHYIALKDYFDINYKYQSLRIDDLSFPYTGKVVFSRYPLTNYSEGKNKFDELFLRSSVEVDGKNLNLVMVHTTAPVNVSYYNSRNAQLEYLKTDVITETSQNTLLTGDFNVSPWSPRFIEVNRYLNNLSMDRVHTNEFDYTWEYQDNDFFKSHIDHTYTSDGITTTSYEYKDFPGSDHKAQVFTLAFE